MLFEFKTEIHRLNQSMVGVSFQPAPQLTSTTSAYLIKTNLEISAKCKRVAESIRHVQHYFG
jgi:hypothetical protein